MICLLQGVNRILAETHSRRAVLAYLLEETAVISNVEGCLLWLFEEELTDTLICKAAYPDELANLHSYPLLPLGIGVVGQVAGGLPVRLQKRSAQRPQVGRVAVRETF